jgi:AraC family transcriptional regulator
MKADQWITYEDRLNRVTQYIYDHLDEPLDLATLAGVAALSPYHWHRIYHAVRGETIAATVRRLRLQRAAVDLAQTSLSFAEIAARAGYGSEPAFARASPTATACHRRNIAKREATPLSCRDGSRRHARPGTSR